MRLGVGDGFELRNDGAVAVQRAAARAARATRAALGVPDWDALEEKARQSSAQAQERRHSQGRQRHIGNIHTLKRKRRIIVWPLTRPYPCTVRGP